MLTVVVVVVVIDIVIICVAVVVVVVVVLLVKCCSTGSSRTARQNVVDHEAGPIWLQIGRGGHGHVDRRWMQRIMVMKMMVVRMRMRMMWRRLAGRCSRGQRLG